MEKSKARKAFRGEPNTIYQGFDSHRGGGGARVFVTDENEKLVREITPQRVKALRIEPGAAGGGGPFEKWYKPYGMAPPKGDDLELLNLFKGKQGGHYN